MTKDNWLAVMMIVAVAMSAFANFFGPSLAVIVQRRMSQTKPKPVTRTPKTLDKIAGLYVNLIMALVNTTFAVGFVVYFGTRTNPIGRYDIIMIALWMCLSFFNLDNIAMFIKSIRQERIAQRKKA
jgi:hypothetical protein